MRGPGQASLDEESEGLCRTLSRGKTRVVNGRNETPSVPAIAGGALPLCPPEPCQLVSPSLALPASPRLCWQPALGMSSRGGPLGHREALGKRG